MKTIIIGGVAGGMSAATRLRRNDEHAEIVVYERGEHVSFANCGLPYHVSGIIAERGDLLLQTPEALKARFNIDVRTRHEVVSIDTAAQTVMVRDVELNTETVDAYDSLLISTGAKPFIPPIKGIERALTLRDISDLDQIIEHAKAAKTAVIIGGGFIGLELTENLVRLGIDVTVLERSDQILGPLDPEMVAPVHEHLIDQGVTVRTNVNASKIGEDYVALDSGEQLAADIVISAIGVRPESELAKAAGITIGETGGISVDEMHRTSAKNVYAVGDACEKHDAISGEAVLVPLAQTANRHGRQVADVIVGRKKNALPVLGTAIVGVFDLTVAMTGWSEKRLRSAGRAYHAIHTHPLSHAGYYPGAESMSLKLLVDSATDDILGAQAIGGEGVDKRIDVIATAMRGKLKAIDLADLELAYAPQYGSAKDPVNMLGMIAENVRSNSVPTVQWHELESAYHAGTQIIDVRNASEWDEEHIPNAVHIPLNDLREELDTLDRERPVVAYCAVGQRGNTATRILIQHGFQASNLDGGYKTWVAGTSAPKMVSVGRP